MGDRDPVLLIKRGRVADVVLNRPGARNALNLPMCLALREAFTELDADSAIQVVLLKASGPAFCAGADLKERIGKDEEWVRRRRVASFAAYDMIERTAKPVIALVSGAVVGSGGELAMACDFIVAEAGATFRFPEPHRGTIGATQRLQRVIGKRRAKELLFTNRVMSAEEAEQIGMVARIVPAGGLDDAGEAIAAAIMQAPPLAITLTKQAVDLGSEADLGTGIRIEMLAIERSLVEGDWRDELDLFNAADGRYGGEEGADGPARHGIEATSAGVADVPGNRATDKPGDGVGELL